MPNLRLLGRTGSINVRKVLWTLAEIGEPFAHEEDWATPARPTSLPEFMAKNPNGLVPVLEHDGQVLWESNTICRYLATAFDRTDLLPGTANDAAADRAKVEMWMDWQATDLNTAWRYAFMAIVRKNPRYTNAGDIQDSINRWNTLMTLLDHQLAATGAYVAGQHFTLADIVLGVSAHRWRLSPIPHAEVPHVTAWYNKLLTRPAAAAALSDQCP
jgi:glutathione S-transferase